MLHRSRGSVTPRYHTKCYHAVALVGNTHAPPGNMACCLMKPSESKYVVSVSALGVIVGTEKKHAGC